MRSPLGRAIFMQHERRVQRLLAPPGSEPDIRLRPIVAGALGTAVLYPIHLACARGDPRIVALVVDPATLELRDSHHCTPAMTAARCDHLAALQVLLDAGADVNAVDQTGQSMLLEATRIGRLSTVDLLLRHSARVELTDEDGNSPLTAATFLEHWAIADRLVLAGASVDVTMLHGCTSLYRAAGQGQLGRVQWLLAHGASTAIADVNGVAPLAAERPLEAK